MDCPFICAFMKNPVVPTQLPPHLIEKAKVIEANIKSVPGLLGCETLEEASRIITAYLLDDDITNYLRPKWWDASGAPLKTKLRSRPIPPYLRRAVLDAVIAGEDDLSIARRLDLAKSTVGRIRRTIQYNRSY
jgi:hypothetical protein